jgi:hypothetical protein
VDSSVAVIVAVVVVMKVVDQDGVVRRRRWIGIERDRTIVSVTMGRRLWILNGEIALLRLRICLSMRWMAKGILLKDAIAVIAVVVVVLEIRAMIWTVI